MTAPKKSERVLLLLGVYRADWQDPKYNQNTDPVVAACVPESVWEHETQEETDARWVPIKKSFDPSGVDYEWREVWTRFDVAGLRAPFEIPEVASEIEQAC